jgi:transcriptional regulator with XRE-family HTH domain
MTLPRRKVGELIRRWRGARGWSQLELALEAGISAKHLSFVENGRAQPSREMVMTLSAALDVSNRDCNLLLSAAGFSEVYGETDLEDPRMGEMVRALELLLRQHEPFGAVVFDRAWNVVMANRAFLRLMAALVDDSPAKVELAYRVLPRPRINGLLAMFDEKGFRRFIRNWEVVARSTLARAQREIRGDEDETRRAILQTILRSVPEAWRDPLLESPHELILPVELEVGAITLRFFTTVTTLGTPQDVTLQELRIESYHPMDAATEAHARALAEG